MLLTARCLAPVDNPDADPADRTPGLRREVGRGQKVATIVLAVLIGLCVLGLFLAFVTTPGGSRAGLEVLLKLMLGFAILDVLVIALALLSLWRWGLSGVRAPTVARVLGLVGLSFATVAAVVIAFFFTCIGLANLK